MYNNKSDFYLIRERVMVAGSRLDAQTGGTWADRVHVKHFDNRIDQYTEHTSANRAWVVFSYRLSVVQMGASAGNVSAFRGDVCAMIFASGFCLVVPQILRTTDLNRPNEPELVFSGEISECPWTFWSSDKKCLWKDCSWISGGNSHRVSAQLFMINSVSLLTNQTDHCCVRSLLWIQTAKCELSDAGSGGYLVRSVVDGVQVICEVLGSNHSKAIKCSLVHRTLTKDGFQELVVKRCLTVKYGIWWWHKAFWSRRSAVTSKKFL